MLDYYRCHGHGQGGGFERHRARRYDRRDRHGLAGYSARFEPAERAAGHRARHADDPFRIAMHRARPRKEGVHLARGFRDFRGEFLTRSGRRGEMSPVLLCARATFWICCAPAL